MGKDGKVRTHAHSLAPATTFPRGRRPGHRADPAGEPRARARRPSRACSRTCARPARSTTRPTPSAAPPTSDAKTQAQEAQGRAQGRAGRGREDARGRRRARAADRLAPGPAVPHAAAQRRVVDQGAAAVLRPPRRLRGLADRLAVLPPRRHPDPGARAPSARSTRCGPRARTRRSARPSTSCCRWPPSAPAASRGSTTSPTAPARRRGSPRSPRAPRCRRSPARRRA